MQWPARGRAPEIEIVLREQEFVRIERRQNAHRYEARAVAIGQGTEQEPVHHAEDRRGRAHAERAREDGGGGEPGMADECVEGEAEVLPHYRYYPVFRDEYLLSSSSSLRVGSGGSRPLSTIC